MVVMFCYVNKHTVLLMMEVFLRFATLRVKKPDSHPPPPTPLWINCITTLQQMHSKSNQMFNGLIPQMKNLLRHSWKVIGIHLDLWYYRLRSTFCWIGFFPNLYKVCGKTIRRVKCKKTGPNVLPERHNPTSDGESEEQPLWFMKYIRI